MEIKDTTRTVFHCNGLLLCTTKANKLVVWNPCSCKRRWIQPRLSYKEIKHYALGYDNRSACYQILTMNRSGDHFPLKIEYQVYEFTSKLWRVVGETGDWFIPRFQRLGTSVKGNIYWLAFSQQGQEKSNNFVYLLFRASKVWIATKMEITKDISWSKFLTVSKFDLRYHLRFCIGMSFLVDQENKVVVSCNHPQVLQQHFDKLWERINTYIRINMVLKLLPHLSSLMFQVWLKSNKVSSSWRRWFVHCLFKMPK
ncbi:hypothetical protein ARALYDRAFT_901095 [Arabidopsis lyrata subsp. lyrata]|uniref:F-box associated beta-propeller type 1 domain-containing protein n=1 Tax=Arabidopsis lyrata subsp. lyrata TaxID=81972 RepID=D7LJH4_ARALL|nr:hypothetical protein ARALYDRAFT_901095 [Arabidopsis lyrata subsp. lyrata]